MELAPSLTLWVHEKPMANVTMANRNEAIQTAGSKGDSIVKLSTCHLLVFDYGFWPLQVRHGSILESFYLIV
jgi:hypothetical protein